jgi:hypothetical protein
VFQYVINLIAYKANVKLDVQGVPPQTAQEIDQGLHMKLRKHICTAALLGIALAFLSVGTTAVAQGLQPPFMAPTPPSLSYGVFYFQAGAKYRNLHTFTMNVSGGPSTIVVDPGTVPFGPPTAGPFGVGTANGQWFDGVLAPTTWTYDNGQVSADVTPPGVIIGCTGIACSPLDQSWVYFSPGPPAPYLQPELGRFVTTVSTADCCDGLTVPYSIGSFQISDPATQVNNLSSIAGTTTVTFTVAVDNSLAFTTNTGGLQRVFEGAVVGPSLETGYQWSNYFDVFYGFSWFTASNSLSVSSVIQGTASSTSIVDTFPFLSDDTSAWPIFAFNSSDTAVNGVYTQNYHLAPNSPANGGIFPTRQFSTVPITDIPTELIQETITNSAEFTPLENRFGARSWAPLWGLGRFGAILGGAIIPTYYKITGSRTDIATGTSGEVDPGQVLYAEVIENKEWRTLYGGFVGADLSLGNTGYFLYGSVDYMWANNLTYDLGTVTTIFNPGGFTAGFSAGIQF